jgi:multiple sugar transport system substrate-binding protein
MDGIAHSRLTRRDVLGLAGLVALSVSACSRGGSAGESSALRYAWWGDDLRASLTEKAIAEFRTRNPTIAVELEYSGFDGYFDKLATQTAGGGAADVFMMNEWNLREYADRGSLADLSEHGLSTDAWSDGAVAGGEVDGKVFGATAGLGLQGVLVDPAFFEQAGVNLPDDMTWTWNDFRELGKELTERSAQGSFGLTFQGQDAITSGYYFGQLGTGLFDDEGVAVDTDAARDWLQLWFDMLKDGTTPSASVALEDGSSELEQSMFTTGRLGMLLIPTNYLTVYEDLMLRELQILRIPTTTGRPADLGMWYRPSQLYCASSSSTRLDDAAALINFFLNAPEAGEILLADRGVPPNAQVREKIEPNVSGADARVLAYIDSCEPDLVEPPPPPPAGAGSYPALLGRHAEDVLFERISPEEGARALLDDMRAQAS